MRLASTLERPTTPGRSCDWPDLDQLLPDGGLPRAVIEITCKNTMFAGATGVVAAAVRAAHRRDPRSWCAWVDADSTLYAPGLARAGIDLARLLVVRAPPQSRSRVTVKLASSGAFDIVVVELPHHSARYDRLVRKLALAAEQYGTSIVLLAPPHVDPWPVALRLEIVRTQSGIDVSITKDRFGRLRLAKTHVPITTLESA